MDEPLHNFPARAKIYHVYIEGRQFVEVDLDKGDGELLRIKRDNRFETIQQQKGPGEKF